MPVQVRPRAPAWQGGMHSWDADGAPIFMYGGMDMKKLIALLIALVCLFGSAMGSPATPTDLYEEFDDDDWGSIDIEFERQVYIVTDRETHYFGDVLTLTAVLVNFHPDDIVTFSWQYAEDDTELDWIFIEDAHEQTYTTILDEINCSYWYRVIVELEGD